MKKLAPFLVVFAILAIVAGVFLSLSNQKQMVVTLENPNKTPINLEKNKYQDAFCGMVIEDTNYASQVIRDDGKSWFFHDHGDFVEWLKDKPFKKKVIIYVHTRDTNRWIDATKAYYTDNEKTPMGYGFGAYEHKKKGMIDFETMRLRVLRGETLNDPRYAQIIKQREGK